jgi:hypothetical protein
VLGDPQKRTDLVTVQKPILGLVCGNIHPDIDMRDIFFDFHAINIMRLVQFFSF